MKNKLLILMAVLTNSLFGQDLTIDPNFGVNGLMAVPSGTTFMGYTGNNNYYAVGNGKLYKFNAAGVNDISYGTNGFVDGAEGNLHAVSENGESYFLRYINFNQTFRINKYNAFGKVDATFANNGVLEIPYSGGKSGRIIYRNHKLYLYYGAKNSYNLGSTIIYKINEDGTFDQSFGVAGKSAQDSLIIGSPYELYFDKLDQIYFKITTTPYDCPFATSDKVFKMKTNGRLDKSFGLGGYIVALHNKVFDIEIYNNKLYISRSNGLTVKIDCHDLTTGAVFTGFGNNGHLDNNYNAPTQEFYGELVQLSGKMVLLHGGRTSLTGSRCYLNAEVFDEFGVVDANFGIKKLNLDTIYGLWSKCYVGVNGNIILAAPFKDVNNVYHNGLVSVLIDGLSSVNEKQAQFSYNAFPNPFQNSIALENKSNTDVIINVMDIQGKYLMTKKINANSIINFDLGELKSGIYFVEWIHENSINYSKIIKE